MSRSPRVGLLWRYEWDPPDADPPKLDGVFSALAELGADAEAVVYSDDAVEQVRAQLLGLDGVLIWVNPIQGGLDRSRLDPLLREVSEVGVFVSAHPDVILRMGTKRVLVDTRSLGWGTETRIYHDWDEFRRDLPRRLEDGAPLVLKQHRGMGGIGIWKVELADTDSVVVQQAAEGQGTDAMALAEFLDSCAPYFRGGAPMVEQPYQPRLPDGSVPISRMTAWSGSRTSTHTDCCRRPSSPGSRQSSSNRPTSRDTGHFATASKTNGCRNCRGSSRSARMSCR